LQAITKLEPDIIVKGGDYTFDTVVGNHLAKVVIFPTVEGHSTTRMINDL
jgi:bifunctional ADP-heptose synthase (sugar kinase/adenylyltransferase)